MPSTHHQLIKQCATRLRGIVEALDNIHDTSPHRWSTDLDDVHSSAESLLALIKDQAPTQAAQGLAGAALAQPSPAQAEAERPEGPTEDELEAAGLGYPLHKEEAVKLWYSGFRSEVITVLEAWEAIGHDTGINPDKEELLDSLRYMLEKCEAHDAALARVAELERQEPVAAVSEETFSSDGTSDIITRNLPIGTKLYAAPVAQAQQLNDLDKQCRDDVARALGLRPNQERGFAWSYLLASIKSCVKASGDSAQAQHSVPDGAADLCRFLAKLYCELDGLRYSTAKLPAEQIADALIFKWPVLQGARNQLNIKRISEQPYDESKLHSAIAAMLAAAPGKEVPQAWIDVQEERRRQITAEGWTPEHDDEHSHGQMARAAACYALAGSSAPNDGTAALLVSLAWPWDQQWWKPTSARRDLVKACALALAEIERLDRAGISQSPQPGATTASS
ncbi:hypothetical protein [Pseudomonas aeruginosa]|uniref:hypothetical protein n=1 Tax=Pseudomonas aeruginosa TaxID=287 RepID=UPI00053DB0DE|nr:hypothetical protein [Pseudomonas aeruginosa]